ncbi:MAG: 4-hydroxy-3-methylbut-2-enyl diphosphate reductase [Opitutales bacterium]|nr:4-hydroxy-3-methylbut-2-enyl diphosphate reductase [Opitutales bacterium]
MKVLRAKSAGFCFGVERAIGIATTCTENGTKTVFTDGPLIHNSQMMELLEKSGVKEIGDYASRKNIDDEIKSEKEAMLVIRAHGVSPERRQYLKSLGLPCKDATCPDVGKIAGTIKIHALKGYTVVIVGDPKHPEVIGLLGYAQKGKGFTIKNKEDVDSLQDIEGDICVVSQSTMFPDDFAMLASYLQKRFPNTKIVDTICGATKARQSEVVRLAQNGAQAIVVIGGKHSANTVKLALLVQRTGLPCFHIETLNELDLKSISKFEIVGVTAGASTPAFLIDEVCKKLESL